MILIPFAHKGEALDFITRKHTLQVDFYFRGLYRHENELVLLTGEGVHAAIDRISAVISYFGSGIDGVINLGIATSLSDKLQENQIYAVRRIFRESLGSQEFRVFETSDRRSSTDCITAVRTVKENSHVQRLATLAPIADRELWGCAAVCHQSGIPLRAYKLISDYAAKTLDLSSLRRQGPVFSKHLFDFYKKLDLNSIKL